MILIGQFDSPFVRRVALAMNHYGFAFEHRPWSVWAQADQIAVFNPLRRVPVLVLDDGETLVESAAILDAIDDMAPKAARLAPVAGAERRAILRVCALATGAADKALSLFYEDVLRAEPTRSSLWKARCETQIVETLRLLDAERAAGGVDHWFGRLSHADIAPACMLRFLGEALPRIDWRSKCPALRDHAARCEASSLFQTAAQPLHVAV